MIKIKRVYEEKARGDGYRVLVDRLWPRGIKKSELEFSDWPKEITPSNQLRKSFAHDRNNFLHFKKAYKQELKNTEAQEEIQRLVQKSLKGNVTLLYAAKDENFNQAVVLKEIIEKESAKIK